MIYPHTKIFGAGVDTTVFFVIKYNVVARR